MVRGSFIVRMSEDAKKDIDDLYYFIVSKHKTSVTAKKYVRELRDAIKSLSKNADIFAIKHSKSFLQYGQYVRRINYKNMTVIYTVHEKIVYVHRVIPASMVTGI